MINFRDKTAANVKTWTLYLCGHAVTVFFTNTLCNIRILYN